MDLSDAKAAFEELTKRYFKNADVVFSKQSFMVKPSAPLVMLSLGTITRPINPPTQIIDGRPVSFYPTTVPVQIDLYTQGKERKIAKGATSAMENTAAEDLTKFVDFLNSEYAIQFCDSRDIAIVVPNAVNDLTDLINDTTYEFRAMVEVELRFTSVAIGYTATLSAESITSEPPDDYGEDIPIFPESVGGKPSAGSSDTTGGSEIFGDAELFSPKKQARYVVPTTKLTPSGGGNAAFLESEGDYFTNVELGNKVIENGNRVAKFGKSVIKGGKQ